MRIIAVLSERHFAQEEVAQLVGAVMFGQGERIDYVADRLRHFLSAIEEKTMNDDLPRHGDFRRHEKGRPIDRVEPRDILADHMRIGGPEFCARRIFVGIAGCGDVVRQGIDPDIHDMLRIARHQHTPGESRARDG